MISKQKRKTIKQFDLWAQFYDSLISKWFFNYYYKKVIAHLGVFTKENILSVGCGTGTLEVSLAKDNPKSFIKGVDISAKMLQRAIYKSRGLNNIEFLEAESDNLNFESNSFDKIICIHSFHHYPNHIKSLKEFNRLMKREGETVIIEGLKENIISDIHLRLNRLMEPGTEYYSKDQFKELLTEAGFNQVKFKRLNKVYWLISCHN